MKGTEFGTRLHKVAGSLCFQHQGPPPDALSSGWVHKNIAGAQDFAWQTGYGAFSVSESVAAAVVQYIDEQQTHHQEMTFGQEFITFLRRHNIQFDPQYVF